MVSDGCGDCAKRLPQKAKTQIQTKRAILKRNLLGTAYYALAALEAVTSSFGWPLPRIRLLQWNAEGSHSCATGVIPTPPYFASHFNSSRTLIFPCQGFFAS